VNHEKWSLAERVAEPASGFNSEHMDRISHQHFIMVPDASAIGLT